MLSKLTQENAGNLNRFISILKLNQLLITLQKRKHQAQIVLLVNSTKHKGRNNIDSR